MTEEEIKQLRDMMAFIEYSIEHSDAGMGYVLSNIAHDCNGLIRQESCFLPRTDGYAKLMDGLDEVEDITS